MGISIQPLAEWYASGMRKIYEALVSASEAADNLYLEVKRGLSEGNTLSEDEVSRILDEENRVSAVLSIIESSLEQTRNVLYLMVEREEEEDYYEY